MYVIGVDFGTESGRAILIDLADGSAVAENSMIYPHGVMDDRFIPGDTKLPPEWALHHPADYLTVLEKVVRTVVTEAEIDPESIIGLGIDCTACTPLPTTKDGTPLALLEPFVTRPHAYVKLWKHHAAQPQATRFNQLAARTDETILAPYGGTSSSEWLLPKTLQIFEEDRKVFDSADYIIEVEDWLVWQLTGNQLRNAGCAGYKGSFRWEGDGYPAAELLDELSEGFSAFLTKIDSPMAQPGTKAGNLTADWAARLGLTTKVAIPVGNMDAHAAVVAAGLSGPGAMLLVMGTSVCNMTVGASETAVPGIQGYVYSGMLPDSWGYEAGQAGVGDVLNWFVNHLAPKSVLDEAENRGISPHQVLIEKIQADEDAPDLVAVEWLNGNRSILVDANLSGILFGLTMGSRPHHIYRAFLEAACFGQRIIIDNFVSHGIPVTELVACGGLASKNPVLMQTLADVTGLTVSVTEVENLSALGAGLHAAVAAGAEAGGFDSLPKAAELGSQISRKYVPDAESAKRLDWLYQVYLELHNRYGVDQVQLMHDLKAKPYLSA